MNNNLQGEVKNYFLLLGRRVLQQRGLWQLSSRCSWKSPRHPCPSGFHCDKLTTWVLAEFGTIWHWNNVIPDSWHGCNGEGGTEITRLTFYSSVNLRADWQAPKTFASPSARNIDELNGLLPLISPFALLSHFCTARKMCVRVGAAEAVLSASLRAWLRLAHSSSCFRSGKSSRVSRDSARKSSWVRLKSKSNNYENYTRWELIKHAVLHMSLTLQSSYLGELKELLLPPSAAWRIAA